jgi:hypothetical protein
MRSNNAPSNANKPSAEHPWRRSKLYPGVAVGFASCDDCGERFTTDTAKHDCPASPTRELIL